MVRVRRGPPSRGGRQRLGLAGSSTAASTDPATWRTAALTQLGLFGAVYNNLTEIDADNNAIPELAESWEASKDARIWTFKLRKGAEFHNGRTLVAEDVIASINYHRSPDSKSAARTVVEPIQDIRADGADTGVFELRSGNTDFPYLVNDYHLVIMPVKDGKADWQSVAGTGGYTMESFDPGVRMQLKRQPNYWKAGRAHFDEAELLGLNDSNARMTALMTGQVDAISRVDLKVLDLLRRRPGVVIEEVTSSQQFTIHRQQRAPGLEVRD